jgi:Novel STAND NTPase 3
LAIDYRLDDLGWYQFERLCQALLRAHYGAALEAWGSSQDFGRDAYSPGPLNYPSPGHQTAGSFIFQVKFISDANAPGARLKTPIFAAVRAEMSRIQTRIVRKTWTTPNVYSLLTNAPVSATHRKDLIALIQGTLPTSQIVILGATDIAASLDNSPLIRLSYPQILGLRDLQSLLAKTVNADIVSRSTIALEQVSELAQVFVATGAYNHALKILENHGFAVLTGPPEMGKTATAWMIALARFTNGWEVFDCRSPSELFKVYERERHQLFIADDAFGSTEYRPEIATEWAHVLDRVIGLCGPRHWVIWTSRPAPLKTGLDRLHLQGTIATFPDPMQIHVDASRLSVAEKAQILYRHAKAASLTKTAVDLVRNNATAIVESDHFTPLRIKRLIKEQMPQVMTAKPGQERRDRLREAIESGLQQSSPAMRTSFSVLTEEHRTFLIAMLNGSNKPMRITELDELRRDLIGGVPSESTLRISGLMDDHFIKLHQKATAS